MQSHNGFTTRHGASRGKSTRLPERDDGTPHGIGSTAISGPPRVPLFRSAINSVKQTALTPFFGVGGIPGL